MIAFVTKFYKQYTVLVNANSGNSKYYPFNLWQFWEVTLYDNTLYQKIGKELGKFVQTDPITINCNSTGTTPATITSIGQIQLNSNYSCALNIADSNNGGKLTSLKNFTFDQQLTLGFTISGTSLNVNHFDSIEKI